MANDLDIIRQLQQKLIQKRYVARLVQKPFARVLNEDDIGYALDEKEKVIGLDMHLFNGSDISWAAQFTDLTYLRLSNNNIIDISALKDLSKLKYLYLNDNKIVDISALKNLTELKYLSLPGNQITNIEPLRGLTELTYLNLHFNRIPDIEPLSNLIKLTNLNLKQNQVDDIQPLNSLTALSTLWLFLNKIVNIEPLRELSDLTTLYLGGNQIFDISPLRDLTDLTELYLNDNQITDISQLRDLTDLTKLHLNGNLIADISLLRDLTNLTYIDLSGNQITDIEPLKDLIKLTDIYLSRNQISNIEPLNKLIQLTHLSLDKNPVTEIETISKLTALTYLYLYNISISDISLLGNLKKLKVLSLSDNQITDIEPLSQLTKLRELYLSDNQITDISPLKKLITPDFTTEYLGKEELRSQIEGNKYLILDNNPLEIPPIEIVKQGTDSIINYFKELEKKPESVRLLESKLLIVGNGEVGKTTLMKKLKKPDFQVELGKEPTTHGIKIEPWEMDCYFDADNGLKQEKIKLHFWDFGGQAIYHSTHQFFLTKRSLYLFVWDARKEEEPRSFDYWFNIIKLLSDNSPVIVVMNKSDVRFKHIDEVGFKGKFNNIVAFLKVSCVNGDGIEQLSRQIRLSIGEMPHLHDKLPKVWLDIRNILKEAKKNFISLENYFEICLHHGLDKERAEHLSDYLHDLGVLLHYRHDELLENIVILNPEWATEAVYTLIDTREIQVNKGSFRFRDLKKHWDIKRFPWDKHRQLIRLMEKFELCFNFTGTDIFIVPELLAAEKAPIDFDKYQQDGTLHFQYHYDFMPEGIISRFISRLYYLIEDDHFWKNGVELKFEDSTALVVSEPLSRKLKISVTGSCKSELLAIIRNDLEHIHQTLNMKSTENYHEMVPCICKTCSPSATPHLFDHDELKRYAQAEIPLIRCSAGLKEVTVVKLLKGFEPQTPKKTLLETLIGTLHHLQGISKTIKPDEDSRNGFIALLLDIKGFRTKDQTRWGSSASGKSAGEVDIKIERPDLNALSIIEAFNLKSLDCNVTSMHLTKIFGYDPSGLKENFIIVYAEAADFSRLWRKYLDYIREIDFKHTLIAAPIEQDTGFAAIKLARARHLREEQETVVYHLFVNMKV